MAVETLHRRDVYQPDGIDVQAETAAKNLLAQTEKELLENRTEGVIATIRGLYGQYQRRRVGDRVHIGDTIREHEVIATRTPDKSRLDEIFVIDTTYDPIYKSPQSSYTAMLLSSTHVDTIHIDAKGKMTFDRMSDMGTMRVRDDEQCNEIIKDLYLRAMIAKGTYEMRSPEEKDEADQDTLQKLADYGFVSRNETTLE